MIRSGHVDTFARDNLPPRGPWPEFKFTLPELQYPRTAQLRDGVRRPLDPSGEGDRHRDHLAGRNPDLRAACRAHQPHRQRADARSRHGAGQSCADARVQFADGDRGLSRGHQGGRRHGRHHAAAARQGALLRASPRRRSRSRCATRGFPTRWRRRGRSRAISSASSIGAAARRHARSADGAARLRDLHRLRHRERRRLPDRLHVRHHRRAEGHDAFPSRHAGDRATPMRSYVLQRERATTASSARRRSPSRSASAGMCCFRSVSARPRSSSRQRRRTSCCRRSRNSAPRSASRRRPPIGR